MTTTIYLIALDKFVLGSSEDPPPVVSHSSLDECESSITGILFWVAQTNKAVTAPDPFTVTVVVDDDMPATTRAALDAIQWLNVKPGFAVAMINIDAPALYHCWPDGVVLPSPEGEMAKVTWNWF